MRPDETQSSSSSPSKTSQQTEVHRGTLFDMRAYNMKKALYSALPFLPIEIIELIVDYAVPRLLVEIENFDGKARLKHVTPEKYVAPRPAGLLGTLLRDMMERRRAVTDESRFSDEGWCSSDDDHDPSNHYHP